VPAQNLPVTHGELLRDAELLINTKRASNAEN
jgi:hypothetical protein